jgi:hypothetical protein
MSAGFVYLPPGCYFTLLHFTSCSSAFPTSKVARSNPVNYLSTGFRTSLCNSKTLLHELESSFVNSLLKISFLELNICIYVSIHACLYWFARLFSVPPGKCRVVHCIKPRRFPSKFFPVHHLRIISSFHAT